MRKLLLPILMILSLAFYANAQTPPAYDPTVLVQWTAPVDGEAVDHYNLRWAPYDVETGQTGVWYILQSGVNNLEIAIQVSDPQYYQFLTGDTDMGAAWDWFEAYVVQVRGVTDLGQEGSWSVSSDPFIAAGDPPGNPGKPTITIVDP